MSKALFLKLMSFENKPTLLAQAIDAMQQGQILDSIVSVVDPASFSQIPGSPFAYWVSEHIRHIFREFPAFQTEGRTVKQGLATADDFRFVRLWWEVKSESTASGFLRTKPEEFRRQTWIGKCWIPLTKGGAFSPYYSELQLVVNWNRDGEDIRNFDRAFIRNENLYFHSGLTWPSRPHKRGAFSNVPNGTIFSHTGTMLFLPKEAHWATLALLNSDTYIGLLHLLMARGGAQSGQTLKYEIGYVASVPIPSMDEEITQVLSQLALESYSLSRLLSTANESGHFFCLPALLQVKSDSLAASISLWQSRLNQIKQRLSEYQCEVNDIAFHLYRIDNEDRNALEESLEITRHEEGEDSEISFEDEDISSENNIDTDDFIVALLSYSLF